MMSFRELLKKHRNSRGLSMGELARVSGTVQATISLVEHGKRTPPADAVEAWANAMGLQGSDRSEFLAAGARAKANAQQKAAPYVEQLEDANDQLQQHLAHFAAIIQEDYDAMVAEWNAYGITAERVRAAVGTITAADAEAILLGRSPVTYEEAVRMGRALDMDARESALFANRIQEIHRRAQALGRRWGAIPYAVQTPPTPETLQPDQSPDAGTASPRTVEP